jgi:hypothetical protein
LLKILQESETNDFDGITTAAELSFQRTMAPEKMFARSATDVIPRTRQAVGAKKTMITMFFTAKKLIMFDILPRGSTFKELYFINNIFPDFKIGNMIFRPQKTRSIFWVHIDNSMCHNGSSITSKIKKNDISRMPRPLCSPDISPCDFWFFGMLKQILRDREFSSSDEIEDAIAQVWNNLTFNDFQSVFRDWVRHLAWVAENDGEYMGE